MEFAKIVENQVEGAQCNHEENGESFVQFEEEKLENEKNDLSLIDRN